MSGRFCTCPECGTTHDIHTCYVRGCKNSVNLGQPGFTDALGQRILICVPHVIEFNEWIAQEKLTLRGKK